MKYHIGFALAELEPMTRKQREWWMIRIGKQKDDEIAAMKKGQ